MSADQRPDKGEKSRGRAKAARRPRLAAKSQTVLPYATLADLEDEEIEWLWYLKIVANAVCLLAGPSEQGKSTIATALAAAATTGRELPGGPELRPRNVLWYGAEEFIRATLKPRMHAAGGDLARVVTPEFAPNGTACPRPRLPRDVAQLGELARRTEAGLIVLDPIKAYIEPDLMPDANTTARDVCQCLFDMAQSVKTTVLIIAHPRKLGTAGPAIEQVAGGREWTNHPRCVLLAGPHPDQEGFSCLVNGKKSVGVKAQGITYRLVDHAGQPVVEWGEDTSVHPDQLFDQITAAHERDALADAKMLLIDRLSVGEQRAKDLLRWSEESGVSTGTLRRAKKALGVTSHTRGNAESKFHVWKAPEGGFPKPEA